MKECETIYIILKKILSALTHFCNLETEQKSYGLVDSLAPLQQNTEHTPTKPELGNAKLQNVQVSGSEEWYY